MYRIILVADLLVEIYSFNTKRRLLTNLLFYAVAHASHEFTWLHHTYIEKRWLSVYQKEKTTPSAEELEILFNNSKALKSITKYLFFYS